jgi:hypothetical protein
MGINSAPTGRLLTDNLAASVTLVRQPQEAVASTPRPSGELTAVWSECGSGRRADGCEAGAQSTDQLAAALGDDPGLMGALVGAPIGMALGGILGFKLF